MNSRSSSIQPSELILRASANDIAKDSPTRGSFSAALSTSGRILDNASMVAAGSAFSNSGLWASQNFRSSSSPLRAALNSLTSEDQAKSVRDGLFKKDRISLVFAESRLTVFALPCEKVQALGVKRGCTGNAYRGHTAVQASCRS